MEASARDSSSVQVALRIRPQNNREKLEGSRVCTLVVPNEPQVTIGAEKSFTYDFVYDIPIGQETIYNSCISKLVSGLFDGFNATVLAYGQTGSGKTFTMGTAFDKLLREDEIGVIPRAIQQVFHQIVECKTKAVEEELPEPTFEVGVQFVELYNEEVIDLLADDRSSTSNIRIHENSKGEIYLHGVAIRAVEDLHSTVEILKNGALNRTVASTNMNEQSSRSHAIFSMIIKQQRVVPITPIEGEPTGETEVESLTAKFHFVDLAGSERLKRTGATGNRAKEGISINSGLLALGNVISALGSGRVGHVPYRDSKLTRLLQDSLGGNSRTLMIACVSPSDCDFVETLNTLNYANRAKNIKNKIVANQDKSSKVIGELRSRIASLEMELLEYKQGRRTVTADGSEIVNDQYHENLYLTEELNRLRFRIKTLQETIEILQNRNVELIAKADGIAPVEGATEGDEGDAVQGVVRKYLTEVETLRSSLFESQATCDQLRKEMVKWKLLAQSSGESISATAFGAESSPFASNSFTQRQLIEEARADIDKMKKSMIVEGGSTSDYVSATDDGDDGTSNDMDDIDDLDEEEDEEESESFGESREEAALRDNLNALQDDINIKERLINELEKSERRLKEVRLTYEKKLSELSLRIQQTEAERDRVLAEKLSKKGDNASQEQAKRIREEYERKLTDMKNEYKKLRAVEKEHRLMQARYNREQEQKARLVADLTDMKRQKVDLVKKLNEEAKKSRQQEMTNRKNMMAQDKAMRLRDNKIRQLENKDRQREIFMKRTNEEMQRLRQKAREQEKAVRLATTPSRVVASRFNRVTPATGRNGPPPQITFSPKLAKIKWGALEKKLAAMINKKQTTNKMEDELNRLVEERHRITDEITALDAKFVSTTDVDERRDLEEQRDAYAQKKTYIQDQITEVQGQIVALDEANKGDGDDESTEAISEIEGLMDSIVNVVEAKYLLQHMYNNSLETGVLAANLRATKLELEARIQQLEQQRFMNEQLLSTVIEGKDKDLANDLENVLENGLRKKNRSPSLQSLRNDNPSPTGTESSESGHQKIRRRTSNVEELLYPMPEQEKPVVASSSEPTEEDSRRDKKKFDPLPPSASATHPPAFQRGIAGRNTISSIPSTSRSNGGLSNGLPPRPGLMRMKSAGRLPALAEEPRSKREKTPERQKSVFARLIPAWSVEASPSSLINRKQGRFAQAKVNGNMATTRVVTRTHTAEGHSKSVMTVAATNDMMLTGSKDRTAKLWDLATGQELRTLGVHPNTVHSVRFVPNSSLALSVSTYQVRVWDLRSHQCLRVLQSSGQVIEGDGGPVGSRQNTMPFLETMINAAEVDSAGRFLFTSFAGDVRIWDIGRWASFGRLAGASHSPKSEVSCLSVTNNEEGVPFVFTGSRDHYVKMYEVNAGGEGVHDSVVEFQPPHYDNVTCTLAIGNHLYTSGKDTNIMKFSLKDFKRDHLELKAHNSYVQGMCLTGFTDGRQLLTSVCKAGVVKFWDVETTRRLKLVEEIQAHEEAIHAVCSNDYLVFTASSDQTVGVWKINQTSN